MQEAIGWFSSFVLLLTIGRQVYKQWSEDTSQGVSKWLYIGQITANLGFIIYSALLGNWVFLVTNVLLLFSSILGLGIVAYHRRRNLHRQRHKPLQPRESRSQSSLSA